jgi:hypothetical protein
MLAKPLHSQRANVTARSDNPGSAPFFDNEIVGPGRPEDREHSILYPLCHRVAQLVLFGENLTVEKKGENGQVLVKFWTQPEPLTKGGRIFPPSGFMVLVKLWSGRRGASLAASRSYGFTGGQLYSGKAKVMFRPGRRATTDGWNCATPRRAMCSASGL